MQRSLPFKQLNKYPTQAPLQESVITDELFHELKEKVFARRPKLREIIEQYGDMSLFAYAKHYNEPNTTIQNEERRKQFVTTFANEVKRLLGKEIAKSVEKQLATIYRVTTTDHHGPLSASTMTNSNLHEALPYLNVDDTLKNILALGCSNVSFH